MDNLEAKRQPRSKAGLYIIAFLRYVVLCSGAIACYCLYYLAYEHTYHYCTTNPWNCTEAQMKHAKIPWAIILFILAVSPNFSLPRPPHANRLVQCEASTLESLFSTWYFLNSDRQQLNYTRLLATTTPVTLFFLISYWMFYNLPGVILPCPWGPNNTYRNVKLSPETFDCCIAFGVLIAGGIAV